jgi:hypothetical protein
MLFLSFLRIVDMYIRISCEKITPQTFEIHDMYLRRPALPAVKPCPLPPPDYLILISGIRKPHRDGDAPTT